MVGEDDLGGTLGVVDWLFAWWDAEGGDDGQGGWFVNTECSPRILQRGSDLGVLRLNGGRAVRVDVREGETEV